MSRLLLFIFFILVFGGQLLAHPASRIDCKIEGGRVDLAIEHQVKDPAEHFIRDLQVSVNGKNCLSQTELRQVDAHRQMATYLIPGIIKGDIIKVFTRCNKFGDFSSSFTVN